MNDASPAQGTSGRSELVEALSQVGKGNRRAFAEVYDRTSGKLFGICLRILGNRSEAEDALQEAYLNVGRKSASFDPERCSPITWLAALARNKAIDRLRARPRPAEPLDPDTFAIPDASPSALGRLEASEEERRLSRCIDELETRQAAAIREAFLSGATYADLAIREGVPTGTMKSWIRRSLLRLRACLER